jgi:hypothetical protein
VSAVLFLAWARLTHRPSRWLLVALGVAAATVLPVASASSATIVATQALRYGVAQLSPGQRSLIVSFPSVRLPSDDLAAMDRQTRSLLGRLADRPARAEVLFRRLADGSGGSFFLGAADDLRSAVRITSGRAPQSCTPQRCEVVVVGEGAPPLDPTLGLVIVGRAVRTDPLLLTGTFDPGHDAPLLLADGVDRAAQLDSLQVFQRSYGWVTAVDLDRVAKLGVDGYLDRSANVGDDLFRWRPGLILTAPDNVLRDQNARAQRSARRFALLGGAATALLLGFALIGAIGLRRDHGAAVELLRRRGATRPLARLLNTVEAVVPVAVGTLLGLALGGVLAALRALAAGLPLWPSVGAALRSAMPQVLVGALAATVVVGVTLAWPAVTAAKAAWRAVDVTVLAGLAIAALAIARGTVSTGELAERTDPLLLALPVIFVVCGGLLVGRVWPVLTAGIARAIPTGALAWRLGLLGALRRQLRPVATAAFLAAATGIVVFASAYRATLQQGAADQAAFAVPLDARITTGSNLDRPLDVASPGTFGTVVPGATVHQVLRANAGVRVSAVESLTADVIGVDPAALTRVNSWDNVVGGSDPADAARRIAVSNPAPEPGMAVPSSTQRLEIPVSGDVEQTEMVAWLRAGDGRDIGMTLSLDGDRLVARIPAGLPDPVRLFSFGLTESTDYATHHQHRIGEGDTGTSILAGTVHLGLPRFTGGGASQTGDWTGWGSAGAQVSADAGGMTIGYQFTGARIVVRAGGDQAEAPIPVLADPATAAKAAGGTLQLVVDANAPIPVRVVRTLPRFPTAGQRFVVADSRLLADALDEREPGTGSVQELWLSAPSGQTRHLQSALRAPPYDRLSVDFRLDRERALAGDPLARGAESLLTSGALLALAVAVMALVLLVVAERRDESAELYAWESDGVSPGTLRLSLFARAVAVVAAAVPGGLLIGVALSLVTTGLVTVTAVGTAPVPPLALAVGPQWMATVVVSGVLIGLAAAGGIAAAALRERLPRRPEEALR